MYTEIVNQNTLVLDNNGKKVVGGKIEFLDPISLNYINTYTYNPTNDSYITAENPIYLDVNSRPVHTYFVSQLTYCRLYAYIGNFGDPMIDDDVNNWKFVRDWYGAYNEEENTDHSQVNTIKSLQDADPSLGIVTVTGYWDDKDCESRNYIWDANCSQDADNGYIVKSNKSDTGRWILKYDHEWIPSSYYGVYPGHEENMNALLNYSDTVGTNEWPTAPGIYFIKGNYNYSTQMKITDKKVLVDADTKFFWTQFKVAGLNVIGTPTHWIGDFYFENKNQEVHSSWFKTVNGLFGCNCGKLIIDTDNFFTNNTLSQPIELQKITIEGDNYIDMKYAPGAYLGINKCTIFGEKIFRLDKDYLKFNGMNITDRWFNIINKAGIDVAFTNNVTELTNHAKHIYAPTSSSANEITLDNIDNVSFYVAAMSVYNPNDVLDLKNNEITTLYAGYIRKFGVIKNAVITPYTGYTITLPTNCYYENVVADTLVVNNNSTIQFKKCKIDNVTTKDIVNCTFTIIDTEAAFSGVIDSKTNVFYGENSKLKVNIGFTYNKDASVDTAYTKANLSSFYKSTIHDCYIHTNQMSIRDSLLNNVDVEIYPIKSGATKYFESWIYHNELIGSSKITMRLKNPQHYQHFDNTAHTELMIKDNRFNGSDLYCIYAPYWASLGNRTKFFSGNLATQITGNVGVNVPGTNIITTSDTMTLSIQPESTHYIKYNPIAMRLLGIDYNSGNYDSCTPWVDTLIFPYDSYGYNNSNVDMLRLIVLQASKRDYTLVESPASVDNQGDAFLNHIGWEWYDDDGHEWKSNRAIRSFN